MYQAIEVTVPARTIERMPISRTIYSIEDVVKIVQDSGSHFFDKDTMRGFRSRLAGNIFAKDGVGVYFVTSEQFVSYSPRYHVDPRMWTVRLLTLDGSIERTMAGEKDFQQFDSLAKAYRFAVKLAKT